MPNVYLTINEEHLKKKIKPYFYIGSDQKDRNSYLGSSKRLKEDIKLIGKSNFRKIVILHYDKIDNVSLRSIESNLQTQLNCAGSSLFYNKTNTSHKGFIESEEEKAIRMKKCHDGYIEWWNSLTKEEKDKQIKKTGLKKANKVSSELRKGKKYSEYYGKEKSELIRKKISKNNGMRKFSDEQKKQAIVYFKSGMTRKDAAKKAGISYGIMKSILRN